MEQNETSKKLPFEEIKKKLNQSFDELLIGESIDLPISMLKPKVPYDGTSSHTSEIIEVFRNSNSSQITIDDGHHRYYMILIKEMNKSDYTPDKLNTTFIKVRKVIPEIEW